MKSLRGASLWLPIGLVFGLALGFVLFGGLGTVASQHSGSAALHAAHPSVPERAGELSAASSSSSSLTDLDAWARCVATEAYWHFPGRRNLEADSFGSPANAYGSEFGVGVPYYDRLDDGQGAFTTTAGRVTYSNVTAPIRDARLTIAIRDRTPRDLDAFSDTTFDEVDLKCTFTDPFGRKIEIRATEALPKGPVHSFWGGTAVNVQVHGRSGFGSKLLPQLFAYMVCYAKGTILIDGQLLPGNDNRLIHAMVTEGFSDPGNQPGPAGGSAPFIASQAEVDRNDLDLHISLPGVRFTPGPRPNSPVVGVGYTLNLTFEKVRITGSSLVGGLSR